MKDGKYGVDYGRKLHCSVTVDIQMKENESENEAIRRLQQALSKADGGDVNVWSVHSRDVSVQRWERLSW